jgi:large subunit ribosomal protein L9
MKVILNQDVAKIGYRNEVVDVPNGYALNELIPKKKAIPATPQNLKRVGGVHAAAAADAASSEALFAAALIKLSEDTLTLTRKANDQGHLYESVDDKAIIAAASERDIALTSQMISIPEPIKATGDHTVLLQSGEKNGSFTVNVSAE